MKKTKVELEIRNKRKGSKRLAAYAGKIVNQIQTQKKEGK